MKAVLVLAACAAAALLSAHQASADPPKGPPPFIVKCMEENKVTEADVTKFAETGEASDDMKCNFKCIMLGAQVMTEDGKLLLEPMIAHVPEKVHPAFKKCVEIETSADLCDLAYRHNKCLREEASEWYQEMVKNRPQ